MYVSDTRFFPGSFLGNCAALPKRPSNMERRLLTSICDHHGRPGAFATKWEGWKNPRNRATVDRACASFVRPSRADDFIDRVDPAMGVYAFLHQATPSSRYVLYVGFSSDLAREVETRANQFDAWGDRTTLVSARYLQNYEAATNYEDDLIRYYAPPWNVRFSRQRR